LVSDFNVADSGNIYPFTNQEASPMVEFIIISIVSGFLFAILDGVINANPLGQRLYKV
jgi:hypothetical protein